MIKHEPNDDEDTLFWQDPDTAVDSAHHGHSLDTGLVKIEPQVKKEEPTSATSQMDLDSDPEDATAHHEVVDLSNDEDDELDETEDGMTGPEFAIKQEFSEEIYGSHEKGIVNLFVEDLEKSFSQVVGSQISVEKPAKCCSLMHGEIRFTIQSLPVDIE